jgi:hypothetical protein
VIYRHCRGRQPSCLLNSDRLFSPPHRNTSTFDCMFFLRPKKPRHVVTFSQRPINLECRYAYHRPIHHPVSSNQPQYACLLPPIMPSTLHPRLGSNNSYEPLFHPPPTSLLFEEKIYYLFERVGTRLNCRGPPYMNFYEKRWHTRP